MIADFDLNLGLIAQQLEDSLDRKTISYAPRYTVMDISTDNKESITLDDDLQHDVANPLIVNDYSVYVKQANC